MSHPNIVQYVDSYCAAPNAVILMEYCDAGDLSTLTSDVAKGRLVLSEVPIGVIQQRVLQALVPSCQQRSIVLTPPAPVTYASSQTPDVLLSPPGCQALLSLTGRGRERVPKHNLRSQQLLYRHPIDRHSLEKTRDYGR